MIELRHARLIQVDLPLVRPFRTSFGVQDVRKAVLLEIETRIDQVDSHGWGECVAGEEPFYSSEWAAGAWALLRDLLVPMVASTRLRDPEAAREAMSHVKGNPMAKATIEMALLDAILRSRHESLKHWLGGTKDRVACGVSIGITPSLESLLDQIHGYLDEGYRRIKLKIEPGNDVAIVSAAREKFPDTMMTVDANQAYASSDIDALRALDAYDLTLIEQPFAEDDIRSHAALASKMKTRICLDETITSTGKAIEALDAKAASIINIKQGRMGGVIEARNAQAACFERGVPVWCGGMLETGIGRAVNLALASLEAFTLPGDTSASKRYFAEDITEPFEMDPHGTIAVPDSEGIGSEPAPERLKRFSVREEVIQL